MKTGLFRTSYLSVLTIILCILTCHVLARPVDQSQAEQAGRGWLAKNARPMGHSIHKQFNEAVPYTDQTGQALYYVIELEPEGFMVMSTDDRIEPVIAFSATGYFVDDGNNPLKTMLDKDMKGRLEAVQSKAHDQVKAQKRAGKWQSLQDAAELKADGDVGTLLSAAAISDVYVEPFVESKWDQDDVGGSPCYNYYTPNNYVCGCVATTMAQLMRYYSYPTSGIGVHAFNIRVDNNDQDKDPIIAYTRGGDGSGGAYHWSSMPYVPTSGVTSTQRQAIGALCYDAAISVGMSFTSLSSSASLWNANQRLVDTFMYSNSIYSDNFSSAGDDRLWDMMNTNLDARMPVILGIRRTSGGGHAVIADGYGYNNSTLYHHINMGWGGTDNAWYQLPTIDAYFTYTMLDDCIYNVYKSGSGEIISGRVTNLAGAPVSGATVTARLGTTVSKQTITDSRGIYALTNLSSNKTYKISATKSGENFSDQYVTVGKSSDSSVSGNQWGINFVSATVSPPTAMDIVTDVDSNGSVMIQLQALDEGDPDPNLMQYIVTSLPQHGILSEPNVGTIETVPYPLIASDANGITYTPCPCFGGVDTFTYKSNDGGTYPTGGDSNIATVTVNVNDEVSSDFGTDSYTFLYGIMMNTEEYYHGRSQVIYTPSDVGSAKKITDLALNIGRIPGRTLSDWTIRMKHTSKSYFLNSAYQLETSGWTIVYQADVTISQTGWYNFHFDTPFDYNGIQNLMVDFSFSNNGTSVSYGGYYVEDVTANRVYSVGSKDISDDDPLTWTDWYGRYYSVHNSVPSIKLIGSIAADPMDGDFDASCDVKLPDLAIFSQAWNTQSGDADYNADCDLTTVKGAVDIQDLAIFSDQWLQTYPW